MGLFDFMKKKPPKAKVEMVGYENGKMVDLQSNQSAEDKGGWKKQLSISLTLNSEIRPLENAMVGFADALSRKQKVDDEIVMLESLIEYYEEIRRKCYTLGPDYVDYFTRAWAEIRKEKDDGPEYVTRYRNRIKYIRENYDELLGKEILHENESENLEYRVLDVLKREGTILQTDVYKHFDSIVKSDIQSILYFMEKDGRITREKSGRTYVINYVK